MTEEFIHHADLVQKEWRELGYYFDFDESSREVQFFGDSEGLRNFCAILREYASDPDTFEVGHMHVGPYWFEVRTTLKPISEPHMIGGSQEDLLKLANEVDKKIELTEPGDFFIAEHFQSPTNVILRFFLQPSDFDPGSKVVS